MAWPSDGSYTAWSSCFKVTSQASKISGALGWYFLDLSLMPSAFWSAVQADGDDLRFTEDDGETAVYHRLIYINVGATDGLVAIAQPHGSSGATVDIDTFCYVGNAGASSTGSTSVWPSSLQCLYMLQEQPTSSTAILDSTANARHSTSIAGSMTSGDLTSGGPHGGLQCINFDGNDRIAIPSTIFDACESANAYTWFGWLRLSSNTDSRGAFGSLGSQFSVRYDGTVGGHATTQRNSANSASFTASYANSPSNNVWHFVCVVYNGSTLKLYCDGAEIASVSATSLRSASLAFYIGHDNTDYWRGDLCEIGLYSEAMSADQVATFYANETDAGFWVVTEHTGGGGGAAAGSFFFGG
jgi:hypothetical protein